MCGICGIYNAASEEAVSEPSDLGVYLISKLARQHVKVVLSGEGGDELFSGYPKYVVDWLAQYYHLLPASIRERAIAPLLDHLPYRMRKLKSAEMKQATRHNEAFIIPNGVDFALFHPIPRAEARTALGWDTNRSYVLFGNDPDIPRKNFALAQAAVAMLQTKGIDVALTVANGLPQTQVVQYINACNALVLPSLIEGSPNIVKEAMACNVPVVATAVGDVRQVIGQTDGCAVCPPDPAAFAHALEQAILRTRPTTGRKDIQHLDRTVVAQQVIAVYEQAIRKKSRI